MISKCRFSKNKKHKWRRVLVCYYCGEMRQMRIGKNKKKNEKEEALQAMKDHEMEKAREEHEEMTSKTE